LAAFPEKDIILAFVVLKKLEDDRDEADDMVQQLQGQLNYMPVLNKQIYEDAYRKVYGKTKKEESGSDLLPDMFERDKKQKRIVIRKINKYLSRYAQIQIGMSHLTQTINYKIKMVNKKAERDLVKEVNEKCYVEKKDKDGKVISFSYKCHHCKKVKRKEKADMITHLRECDVRRSVLLKKKKKK